MEILSLRPPPFERDEIKKAQHRRNYASVSMNKSTMVNVTTTQCCRYYVGVSMNESITANVATTQRRRKYSSVSMNESIIANVITTQRRRFYANILMNESIMPNVLTTQLGTSCSFDSPGLAKNEPTLGKHSQGDSTP